ncbi:hypothetical protein SCG7109_AX_00100 [Chlamydiales bacterium SCGC AG-110-M15]|nr:hypothetical protein SCG7109_AX_00100 [Chlamydiales bacterium SCGC AG-110-M15]
MNVWIRLQLIYDSLIGQVLIGFLALIFVLAIVYVILRFRQRSQDALAYRYEQHYSKANELIAAMSYVGRHKADFFGRQTIVQLEDEQHAVCVIPSPDLIDANTLERFRLYLRTLKHQHLPVFAPYVFTHDDDLIILVEAGIIQSDGKLLPTLSEYMLDREFGEAEAELILLEVARALAALHELHTETGEQLYHGFLLPNQIHISVDDTKRIQSIHIANHGLSFAFGADVLHKQIEGLSQHTLQVESQVARELEKTVHYLAPEQLDAERLKEVSAMADFYAFGTLATHLFTNQPFKTVESLEWDKVPTKWQSFLKSCLEADSLNRPEDFLSIQDHLYDPDLALTHNPVNEEEGGDADSSDEPESETVSLGDLVGVLQRSEAFQEQEKLEKDNPLIKHMSSAAKCIAQGKWAFARMHLNKAAAIDPEHAEVNVGLAIVSYEEKEFDEAERYYEKSKQINKSIAKRFREHIAFRV